jgi:FKBP-type peptidyl-prolyl cis-trans isomerase
MPQIRYPAVVPPKHKYLTLVTMKTSFTFLTAVLALMVSLAAASTPEGLAFLATKKTEEGVVELPSGLLYKEIRAGTLMDGTEFDSSYKRGAPLT